MLVLCLRFCLVAFFSLAFCFMEKSVKRCIYKNSQQRNMMDACSVQDADTNPHSAPLRIWLVTCVAFHCRPFLILLIQFHGGRQADRSVRNRRHQRLPPSSEKMFHQPTRHPHDKQPETDLFRETCCTENFRFKRNDVTRVRVNYLICILNLLTISAPVGC